MKPTKLLTLFILLLLASAIYFLIGGQEIRQFFRNSKQSKITQQTAHHQEEITKNSQDKIEKEFQNGDIIFQISQSSQSKAIALATKSIYTHCGIIYEKDDNFFVYEAVQPVKLTPIRTWIKQGKDKHFVVKRLKNADKILTREVLKNMKNYSKQFQDKNYDIYFSWSDDKIYCSELIWKIYKETTGLEIGKLQKLKDFDLTSPEVQQKMKERYGNNIPLEENVISPISMYESDLLMTVKLDRR